MPYPHRIRLRGPWECRAVSAAGATSAPQRVHLPGDWGAYLGRAFRGRVRYTRRFNRPTNLDPHERVWLVVEGADPCATVSLNGERLGVVPGYALFAEFDVTVHLADANELILEIDFPPESSGQTLPPRPGRESLPGGPVGEVYLEVRSTAFLSDLSLLVQREGQATLLELSGRVDGEPLGEPIEIIARRREGELLYGEAPIGGAFRLAQPAEDFPAWKRGGPRAEVEVALVRVGTRLWQGVFHTASRAICWSPGDDHIVVDAVRLELSRVRRLPSDPKELADWLSEGPVANLALAEQVLAQPCYELLDRHRQPVVQSLPLDWSEPVTRRLAHHSCIIAWTTPEAKRNRITRKYLQQADRGRPWVDRDLLTPAGLPGANA